MCLTRLISIVPCCRKRDEICVRYAVNDMQHSYLHITYPSGSKEQELPEVLVPIHGKIQVDSLRGRALQDLSRTDRDWKLFGVQVKVDQLEV